jgi:hypothetical protein
MELALFCSKNTAAVGEHIQKVLRSSLPGRRMEVFPTIEALVSRLRHLNAEPAVAVLVADGHPELIQLLSLRPFLRKTRIILVLPDGEDETIALAHRLRPRYLCYLEDDFLELGFVLGKMLKDLPV